MCQLLLGGICVMESVQLGNNVVSRHEHQTTQEPRDLSSTPVLSSCASFCQNLTLSLVQSESPSAFASPFHGTKILHGGTLEASA
jgi:hypothetical protein